jgi:hypothetical protein
LICPDLRQQVDRFTAALSIRQRYLAVVCVRRTGIPVGRLIREQLETAKSKGGKQRFLRHAGAIAGGPPDVSSRKGFSRS